MTLPRAPALSCIITSQLLSGYGVMTVTQQLGGGCAFLPFHQVVILILIHVTRHVIIRRFHHTCNVAWLESNRKSNEGLRKLCIDFVKFNGI